MYIESAVIDGKKTLRKDRKIPKDVKTQKTVKVKGNQGEE